jgi:hypothetical protein
MKVTLEGLNPYTNQLESIEVNSSQIIGPKFLVSRLIELEHDKGNSDVWKDLSDFVFERK